MSPVERRIITALISDMRINGYHPAAVWDSEEYILAGIGNAVVEYEAERAPHRITRALTDTEVLEAIDAVDADVTLHFTHCFAQTWGNRGVLLICGNGEDVISDYHCADGEDFGKIIERIYARIEKGEFA